MTPCYDVAIVGLGAVGSAAAYHAAGAGFHVVGFDRFASPHTRGSTHGGSRIIRRAYFEGGVYLPLLERAYACWRKLEHDGAGKVLRLCGALTIAADGSPVLEGAVASARAAGVPHRLLTPSDVAVQFPCFRLRPDELAMFEPEAGWIDPEAAVCTHLAAARGNGAALRMNEAVYRWRAEGDGVVVETSEGEVSAAALILCAGGWLPSLLPALDLPLRLERQVNVWYHPARRRPDFRPDRCPVYIWEYAPSHILYGFPNLGAGVKAGLHHTGAPAQHPDELDRDVHTEDIHQLTGQMRRLLPDACGDVARAATCFYTNTPDERFVIDAYSQHPPVVYASACSGHGFKVSSAVGENLALLATGAEPSVDLSPYRADRYD